MRKRIFGFGFIASVLLSGAFCYSAALDLPMVTENRRDLEYDKKFLTERMSALNTQLETLVADYKRAPNDSFFYNELRQVRTEIDNTRGHLAGVEKKLLELGRSNTVPEPVQNLAQVGLPVSVEQKESEKKEEESAPQHESKREWSKRFRAQKEAARNIVTALARGGESEEQILVRLNAARAAEAQKVERLVALYASTQQEVTERSFMERVYEKREQRAIALQHRTEAAAREALMRLRYESPNYGPGNRQPSGNASPDLFERHAVGHERSGKTERSKYSMEDYENEQLKMALRLSLEDGPG